MIKSSEGQFDKPFKVGDRVRFIGQRGSQDVFRDRGLFMMRTPGTVQEVGEAACSVKFDGVARTKACSYHNLEAVHEGYKNDNLPSDSPRAKVLQEAESLITGDRNASYGTPTQNFQNTADLLNVQFGHKLKERFTATDVAMIMIQLKMARLIASPDKRDNWVDLAGYAACGFETTEERGESE